MPAIPNGVHTIDFRYAICNRNVSVGSTPRPGWPEDCWVKRLAPGRAGSPVPGERLVDAVDGMRGDAGEHVECRFGLAGRLPVEIEWLSDSGSPYTARDTRALARGIGVVPCTTPFESPHRTAWRKPSSKPSKRLRQGQRCRMRSACCASSTVHPQGAGLPLATRIPGANGGEDDGKRGRRCASTVNAGRHQMGTAGAFASEQVGDVIPESVGDLLGIQHSLMPAAGRRSRALPAGPAGCAAAGRCDCRPRRAAACRSTPKRCGFALAAAAGAHIP